MITEQFSERTISHMEMALDQACRMVPEKFAHHRSRRFVAEKIVECATVHTQNLRGLTEAGRRAVAELVTRETGLTIADENGSLLNSTVAPAAERLNSAE